jgi:NADH:ubiquinone oxidoreductase subunit K
MLEIFLLLGFALFAIGVAGIAASRHFVIMILAVEIILVASSLIAVSLYSFLSSGEILSLLFVIWSIAAIEVIALVVFYRYLAKLEVSLDVTKLIKYKEK